MKVKSFILSAIVLSAFSIAFMGSDEKEESDNVAKEVVEETVPENLETVEVVTMNKDMKKNAMKANQLYADKWFCITGYLGNMDSDGEYFSLCEDPSISEFYSVSCHLNLNYKEALVNKLVEMNKGDHILVKGKVVDCGEVMGYKVNIVDVQPYTTKADIERKQAEEEMEQAEKEFRESLHQMASEAQQALKKQREQREEIDADDEF